MFFCILFIITIIADDHQSVSFRLPPNLSNKLEDRHLMEISDELHPVTGEQIISIFILTTIFC